MTYWCRTFNVLKYFVTLLFIEWETENKIFFFESYFYYYPSTKNIYFSALNVRGRLWGSARYQAISVKSTRMGEVYATFIFPSAVTHILLGAAAFFTLSWIHAHSQVSISRLQHLSQVTMSPSSCNGSAGRWSDTEDLWTWVAHSCMHTLQWKAFFFSFWGHVRDPCSSQSASSSLSPCAELAVVPYLCQT